MAVKAPTTLCFLLITYAFGPILAQKSPSSLKVAVCNPGQVPFASMNEDGKLAGFDVGA
jgi:hypothetical protein